MPRKERIFAVTALAAACAAAGCSGDSAPPVLGLPPPPHEAGNTGAPSALQALLTPKDLVVGTPTEVYTRIARGVLTCWFGSTGPLKASYIYHADAEPASKGGGSEIKILTRDTEADDPRALRAYRVVIAPSQDKTKIEVENVRLPEPLAERLKNDVERWASDEEGCGEGPVTAGWGAEQAVEAPKAQKNKKAKSQKP
ncbi:hypothetical protein [Hyphomicrobium sp.]|uniref:hypothetical protein n=1 Tax=Hyphomicrobium sp. TaxID=82 RepID=UPI002E33F13E|nr:hypothetical protein [Hyphomicrobium sp.]HEX2842597.1 hypothetical protein [Hyphomicrobium sp.]